MLLTAAQHSTAQHSTAQHSTAQHSSLLAMILFVTDSSFLCDAEEVPHRQAVQVD